MPMHDGDNDAAGHGEPAPARAVGALGWTLRETLSTQLDVARDFLLDSRFRDPVIIIWVASFGSALHYPVTTYFLLGVGATKMDIGWLGFIASLGSLVCGPLYGWLLDKKGSLIAVSLAAAACSIGCLIRGMAIDVNGLYVAYLVLGVGAENLWSVVLSHVARHTDPADRITVVSGYLFQVTALRILGRALYPSWNWFLEDVCMVTDTMNRMRIHMGMCTAFCFFGTTRLLSHWSAIQAETQASKHAVHPGHEHPGGAGSGGFAAVVAPYLAKGAEPQPVKFALFATLLVLQSMCVTVANTLWPLFVQDEFGWGAREYAPLVFFSSVFGAAAITLAPVLGRAVGELALLLGTLAVGAAAAFVSFEFHDREGASVWFHCASFIALLTGLALLEPVLKSNASISMPQRVQGMSFGVLTSISGLGVMVGSPVATYLYNLAERGGEGDAGGARGALPLQVVGAILVGSAALLLAGVGLAGVVPGHEGKLRVRPFTVRRFYSA